MRNAHRQQVEKCEAKRPLEKLDEDKAITFKCELHKYRMRGVEGLHLAMAECYCTGHGNDTWGCIKVHDLLTCCVTGAFASLTVCNSGTTQKLPILS